MKKKKKKLKPQPADGITEAAAQASAEADPAADAAQVEETDPAVDVVLLEERDPAADTAASVIVHPELEADEAADNLPLTDEPDSEESDNADRDDDDEDTEEEDPDFRGILEALVFASDEPLSFKQIKELLAPNESGEDESAEDEAAPARGRRRKARRLTITRVKRAIDWLNDAYADTGRSFRIIEVSGGFAFQTTGDFGAWVGRLFAERSRRRLTQSALETLSIIAFRQPISKPAVEGIRGVNADHVVKSLLERNLISIVGREDSPGRPLLYGTTKTFLKHFGLSSINDLPKPREIKDLLSSEDELTSNPIDEMDPEKAAALTRVSSQELERLFDNARLRGKDRTEGEEETLPTESEIPTENETPVESDAPVQEMSAEEIDDSDSTGKSDETELTAPVLHVQFDDLTTEGDEILEPEGEDDGIEADDRDNGDDDTMMEEDLPAEHTPFDDERPDEQEMI